MLSGVELDTDWEERYGDLRLKRTLRAITFGIKSSDLEKIAIIDTFDRAGEAKTGKGGTEEEWRTQYDKFAGGLPDDKCLWVVYDFPYKVGDGLRNKIIFVNWSPEGAKIKDKMLFASSKQVLRAKLQAIGADIQASDKSENTYDVVLEKVKRN